MRRLPLAVAAAAALTAAAPAAAITPPMRLPAPATAASASATWLVGGQPGAGVARQARRVGGTRIAPGTFEVRADRARALARALRTRHLLRFAEPNRVSHLAAVPEDPLSAPSPFREASFDPMLDPPAVTPDSPFLAVIDEKAMVDHPEFTNDPNVSTLLGRKLVESHGTQTLGTAVAPVNGIGITGAYPGARAVNVPLPKRITCGDSAKAIKRAVQAGAAVLNMSYGSPSRCFSEYLALENAVRKGAIPVAASGNDGDRGNPTEYPASLPHILTVGALQPDDSSAAFSSSSAALDLLAPGVGVTAPTPPQFDTEDGHKDGYEVVDGTSFAAPIAAAAALWLRAARPDLTPDQAVNVLRESAIDLGRKGYDSITGYGKLDMAQALTQAPTIADPDEPNDDVYIVNGKVLPGGPAKPIWTGQGTTTVRALLDVYEDPEDVYRIRVPAHRRVTITVQPDIGNADLDVYDGGAQRVESRRHIIATSRRKGKKADRVRIRNKGGQTRTAYVDVFARRRPVLNARYALEIR